MIRLQLLSILIIFVTFKNVLNQVTTFNRNEDLVVETNVGLIRGLRAENGNFSMFMGIPYATVNESNIFGHSIPHPPFEGIFEAYDDSAICPQVEEFNLTATGSLDCLRLNIYVPDSASQQNTLPVMVSIYGGGFVIGFAGRFLYGPEYLVRHDVILVTINYRLGPYGFMCLDVPEIPGNQGLKDQVTALRWVRDNIVAFGGDANQVTVFGNSAGGMSIGLHLMSENERLFTRAIMQSGTSFYSGVVGDINLDAPLILAEALGFATSEVSEAIAFLSSADVHSVVEVASELERFGPCLEKSFPGVERFISERAMQSNHSKVANTDLLLGFNSHEIINVPPQEGIFLSTLANNFIFNETLISELERIVRQFYIGDADINDNVRTELSGFRSDFSFVYSTIRTIQPYLDAGVNKVYQYLFAYDGNRNFVKVKDNITLPGAAHADENGYLFDMRFLPNDPTPEDQLIIDRMTEMWTNFAKYGDPTPEISSLLPVKWEPITIGSPYHYMVIDSELRAERRYEHRRMTFWDLFYKAYGIYERGYEVPAQDGDAEDGGDESENNIDPTEPSAAASFRLNFVLAIVIVINFLRISNEL